VEDVSLPSVLDKICIQFILRGQDTHTRNYWTLSAWASLLHKLHILFTIKGRLWTTYRLEKRDTTPKWMPFVLQEPIMKLLIISHCSALSPAIFGSWCYYHVNFKYSRRCVDNYFWMVE
jgi:hypothetical protein